MALLSRRSQTWCFVALFAAISLFARGVHYHPLFGLHSHACCCDTQAGGCDASHDHAGHAHSPDERLPSRASRSGGAARTVASVNFASAVAARCLVCEFFAKGQLPPAMFSVAGEFSTPPERRATAITVVLSEVPRPYGARAPPASA